MFSKVYFVKQYHNTCELSFFFIFVSVKVFLHIYICLCVFSQRDRNFPNWNSKKSLLQIYLVVQKHFDN
jgi:hypothetical protein